MTDILQKHGITFDEAKHAYTSKAGFPLPSVTQILPFKCDGPEDVIRKAAERGHRVHKWIEELERSYRETVYGDCLLPEDQPYGRAWLKFKEITGFELAYIPAPVAQMAERQPMVERFAFHPNYNYVGRVDLIGYLRRIPKIADDLTLVDAKTGLVSPTTALQTAAYMAAMNLELKALGLPLIKHRWAAKLMPNGECKRDAYIDDRGDLATFLNRLGWVRWAWQHGYEVPHTDYFIAPVNGASIDRDVEEVMARL